MEPRESFQTGRAVAIVVGCALGAAILSGVFVALGARAMGGDLGALLIVQPLGMLLGTFLFAWIGARVAQRSPMTHALAIGAPLVALSLLQLLSAGGRAAGTRLTEMAAIVVGAALGGAVAIAMRSTARG